MKIKPTAHTHSQDKTKSNELLQHKIYNNPLSIKSPSTSN